MCFQNSYSGRSRQRGTTLIVVLVLILLATVIGLFAVKVGIGEQRASGNDFKTRLMRQAAEASMTEGMAYMQSLNSPQLDPFSNTREWTQCKNAADTSFPCGAVPQTGVSGKVRRANMYYYSAGTFDLNGDGQVDAIEGRMLPLSNRLTKFASTGNGFNVQYGVGAVLCPLKMPLTATQTDIDCAINADEESGTYAYTLVAVGSIPGESAHVTLTQTIGAYNLLNFPPGAPPVVASGSVDVTGAGNIVTNPNSGGPGVPVSVWTRGAVDKKGNTNTCYYDEFIRNGAPNGNNKGPTLEPALNSNASNGPIVTQADQIMRCDDCQCQRADSLSFSDPGNKGQFGMDVLQCPSGPGQCTGTETPPNTGANFDIKPNEFPCDLFQYVFKVAGHSDVSPVDSFCEHQIQVTYQGKTMGADQAWLYQHAKKIHGDPLGIIPAGDPKDWPGGCGSLGPSDFGIYWDASGSGCNVNAGQNSNAGSILYPLVLVADKSMNIKGTFFGLAFVRATGAADLDFTTGGNGLFSMQANSALYGAVVVQGKADKLNGSDSVIYSDKVLQNIGKNSVPPAWGAVPGSWTDRFSYGATP